MIHSIQLSRSYSRWSFLVLMGLALSFALTACGGQTVNMEAALESSVTMDDQRLPADIKLASSAILMKMKGYPDGHVQGVSFAPQAAPNMRAVGSDFGGFAMRGVNILNYDVTPQGTELTALMIFEDGIGRRTGVRFLAHYQVIGTGIAINHASVVPVYTMKPRVEAYIVPFDPNMDQTGLTVDHNTIYTHAVTHGVPIEQLPGGTGDYDVFMFVMDRSSPTSETAGRISKTEKSRSGFEDATTVMDFSGWQVAVISGEIDPLSDNKLFAKLLHTPGKEAIWYSRSARMQGLYALTQKAQKVVIK